MPASGNNKFELRFMPFRISELIFQFRFEVSFTARRTAAFEFFQMSRLVGYLLVQVCNFAERAHCRCAAKEFFDMPRLVGNPLLQLCDTIELANDLQDAIG